MLTLKALMYTEDPKYKLAGPIGTMPQGSTHFCKLKDSQNRGEL